MTTPGEEPENWVPELTFGARLALVRHRKGWNIKEAASACGLPAQSWRGWELEGREPHRKDTIAMTIATTTGVDFLWLAHGPTRGAVHRSAWRRGPRVVATVTAPDAARPAAPASTTRSVRQTRPIVGGSIRPLAPAVL